MKCIKNIETGDIIRVEDDKAFKKVNAGTHVYVCKDIWKKSKSQEKRIAEAPVMAQTKKSKGNNSKKGKARKEAVEATAETTKV